MGASSFCVHWQDNWDDEDEGDEKKAEVTKTGGPFIKKIPTV